MSTLDDKFRKVSPYTPGEQPQDQNRIKLNTNENPYPPAPSVKEVIQNLNVDQWNLYPDFECKALVRAIAKQYEVNEDQVFVGVGSDDVLAMAFLTFFNSDLAILFPDITYSFYKVWAQLFQIPYECPPLNEEFRINKEDYMKENGGIVIANPNAPTSIYEELATIREILNHNTNSVVIVDEAYIDFGGESACTLIDEYEQLLVVQTFSKSRSLAGMRIGFAIGNAKLIRALHAVKHSYNSYTLNSASLAVGVAAMEAVEYYNEQTKRIVATREEAIRVLSSLGFDALDSSTNFLFVKHRNIPAKHLFEQLKHRSIYVRYFEGKRVDEYLRITIGTEEQMNCLYRAFEEICMVK